MNLIDFIKTNEDYRKDLIVRSTYNSNGIEGNTLTLAETYAITYNDNSFNITGHPPREIYEAINHKKALEYIFNNCLDKDYVFNLSDIIKINETINRDINDTIGFRKVQVYINGSNHVPPSPERVPNLMNYWLYNYNNSEDDIFFKIAKFHNEFEKIHPFEDGNGRTGRLLIQAEQIKNNIPPTIIEKEYRVEYYELLKNFDITGLNLLFKKLSSFEYDRLEKFGFKTNEVELNQNIKKFSLGEKKSIFDYVLYIKDKIEYTIGDILKYSDEGKELVLENNGRKNITLDELNELLINKNLEPILFFTKEENIHSNITLGNLEDENKKYIFREGEEM